MELICIKWIEYYYHDVLTLTRRMCSYERQTKDVRVAILELQSNASLEV